MCLKLPATRKHTSARGCRTLLPGTAPLYTCSTEKGFSIGRPSQSLPRSPRDAEGLTVAAAATAG
uniref:Uncharacterized protein n=1 Tax=Oryza sativa subsp. japonica TaxID=39947 RepID=Q7F097_ORYSJ|nr:hypothetical protein [Oryza sativa Japonica Group]BAC84368.1 hypothetical protein [Oryza sativa Japonica Group]BAD31525.1 hypothetical protein [Oryza sativa Japonica Group]